MIGRVGHYLIKDRIGRGGMGEIYTAYDERLGRTVVVKAIAADRLLDDDTRKRFMREARAAAALTHPFICTVHEVLEHGAQPFIVMEFVDGESLRAKVARGPLPSADVCRIGVEVAEALAAAHARGIVHRDVTAANIMLTASGHVKVVDFGLAQIRVPWSAAAAGEATIAAELQTSEGTLLGTPAYLAPEVLQGQRADARTDLYSLGVVLYELSTGQLPFGGATVPVVLAGILNRTPTPPRSVRADVPPALERVIVRLLAKDPDSRYADAQSLAADLRAVAAPLASRPGLRSIAVLPFKDLAADPANAHIGFGLADATITELSGVKTLLVRPTAAIMRYQHGTVDPLEAGRELGVDVVVDATFQRSGSRLRATVQLLDVAEARSLWGDKITTSFDDVFDMQDEVSRQIARALAIELAGADQARVPRAARPDAAAYELYMQGRMHLHRETVDSINTAVDCLERARAADPGFALAYAGLADAYHRIAFTYDPEGDWYQRAREMVEEALRLDPQLPEARYMRGRLLWSPDGGFNHAEALPEFGAAVAARPGLYEAHRGLGILLFHISMFSESRSHFERALAINPDDVGSTIHLGFCRHLEGDFQAALDITRDALRRDSPAWAFYQTALAEIQLGRREDADRTIDIAARMFPGSVRFSPLRALLGALRGDADVALQHVELTVRNSKSFGHYHHAQYDVACVHALLGRRDEALQWLAEAGRNGFPCHAFFERDPLLAPIRDDTRFVALMREWQQECDGYRAVYERVMAPVGLP